MGGASRDREAGAAPGAREKPSERGVPGAPQVPQVREVPEVPAVPELSVIVVAYNTREVTRRCLDSVLAAVPSDWEVWVVDNASEDGTAAMVRERFPQVRLIANTENVGYRTANNQAMRRAGGRRFLLLNSDVELSRREAVAELVAAFDGDARLAAVGACLVAPDGRPRPSARRFPGPLRELILRFLLFHLLARRVRGRVLLGEHAVPEQAIEPDLITGACMLVRGEAFEQTGGFDEGIFLYGEELEWCARLRGQGWRIGYAPRAKLTHVGRASSEPALGRRRLALALEGDLRYLARHRSRWTLAAFALVRAAGLAFEAATALVSGDRSARDVGRYQFREHLRLSARYLLPGEAGRLWARGAP